MNLVRRHVSRVKGGGLTRASSAPVLALIASDVLAGAPFDIGSGPTVPDPTTREEARATFQRFAPDLPIPSFVETLKPGEPDSQRQRAKIVASPEELAERFAEELRATGLTVTVLPPAGADVEALAAEYRSLAGSLAPASAYVRAAEPTVVIRARSPGRGGRSGHLAALVARDLPRGFTFLAAASDGVDGASGAAGAIIDADLRARTGDESLESALERFDTAPIHDAAGTALHFGPTGHNLADVHALVRSPTASPT
jgi:hydroxypyruvate reductase